MRQPRKRVLDVLLGAAVALAVVPASTGQWGDGRAENPTPSGHAPIPIQGCTEPLGPVGPRP
jgi:hypothetical protein